ncbi:MAG: helix-turn-helix transcriptional regulator [Lachnospiraceae bacterium]|nr:helix-turn-helix transcriptional regulator [Lachnospiraceae bacterium]
MILADKIIDLRKKNGWSQEELGEQLGVSRQAVSKWESMQTVPDINKIIAMAEVFEVSTDYLLRDEMEEPEKKETKEKSIEKNTSKRIVTMEEANAYLLAVKDASRGIGIGLFLFCVSPIAAAILYALGVGGNAPFTADKGAMFSTIIQTFILAVAVIVFVLSGVKLSKFSYLKKNTFETEYGVVGMVKELMKMNEHPHLLRIIIGVALCFVSVIPLMACSMLAGENDLVIAIGGSVMLFMIGVGIYLLVHTCVLWRGFKKLLR